MQHLEVSGAVQHIPYFLIDNARVIYTKKF